MSVVLRPPGTAGVIFLLLRREVSAKLASPWLFCVATAVCLVAWLYGAGFQYTFETESVLVTTDPLMALNILVVVFLGIVLGLRLSSSIAWEREHQTLQVLLAGPVSFQAVVLAKFLVELCIFALLIVTYFAYLLLAQPLGSGVIGLTSALSAAQMPLHALPILAFGLLISALARTVRGAVVIYLVVVGLLSLFELFLGVLLASRPEDLSLTAIYLKTVMQWTAQLLRPLSPIWQLAGLVEGLTAQMPLTAANTLHALALTAVLLVVAALLPRLRGAPI